MINQVTNNTGKNVFTPLQSNVSNYAITKPFTEPQNNESSDVKKKKSHVLGYSIASATVIVGLLSFLAVKGVSKNPSEKIEKLAKIIEDKIIDLKANNKNLKGIQKFYYKSLNFSKNFLNKSQTIFNIATAKDIWFVKIPKILEKKEIPVLKHLKKFNDKITNLFEKISIRTPNRSYKRTEELFGEMHKTCDEFKIKLPKDQAKIYEQMIQSLEQYHKNGFGIESRDDRFINIVKKGLEGIDEEVWKKTFGDIKGFKKRALNGEFIADSEAYKTKAQFNNVINTHKEKITFSKYDKFFEMEGVIRDVRKFIDVRDDGSRALMDTFKKHLTSYEVALFKTGNKADIPEKGVLVKDLKALSEHISKPGNKYDEKTVKEATEAIKNLTGKIESTKQGIAEDILDIFKPHLSPEDYAKLKIPMKKFLKSLNSSADLEGDKLFDKVRDLYLGSAPHDVLATLGSGVFAGWLVSRADSKDEKISTALKYGIPLIGGVAVATVCTVALVASGPSLIGGIISGFALNKLGEVADDARKKYNKNHP